MAKFSVGHEVKVIHIETESSLFRMGEKGIIIKYNEGLETPYEVKFNNGKTCGMYENELDFCFSNQKIKEIKNKILGD